MGNREEEVNREASTVRRILLDAHGSTGYGGDDGGYCRAGVLAARNTDPQQRRSGLYSQVRRTRSRLRLGVVVGRRVLLLQNEGRRRLKYSAIFAGYSPARIVDH